MTARQAATAPAVFVLVVAVAAALFCVFTREWIIATISAIGAAETVVHIRMLYRICAGFGICEERASDLDKGFDDSAARDRVIAADRTRVCPHCRRPVL